LPITAESSFFGRGEQNENECPIMSFTCDETPGILEMIYLDDGIYFQETNDVFPPIGILGGGHDMVKLGILVDENGIVQQPVFGVSSYKGKEIRIWAEKLYEQLVEEKQASSPVVNEKIQTDDDKDDPITVLKLRFAKGEITKEEYEEMRKTIES
jgi:hypothetical protein